MKKMNRMVLSLVLIFGVSGVARAGEQSPSGETAAIAQVTKMIEDGIRAQAKATGSAVRDAHAKAHGCVKANFQVLDGLDSAVKAGVFAQPHTYSSWIRYSNGSGKSQNDSTGDGRGMAIKLMGVNGSASGTQDFLMINHPVFFVRNAVEYVDFQKAVSAGGLKPVIYLAEHPHEALIVGEIVLHKVTNPLTTRYWSQTPYLLGEKEMKYLAYPCEGATDQFSDTSSPNFLRENMQKQLAQGEACFDFFVQLRTNPDNMPIEDPTVEWGETDSVPIHVAKITIPKQDLASPTFCENLSYTPWHNVPELRPLGGINRARKVVYETVSRVRHELNQAVAAEPKE